MENKDLDRNGISIRSLAIPYFILVDTPSDDLSQIPEFLFSSPFTLLPFLPKAINQIWDSQGFYLSVIGNMPYFPTNYSFFFDSNNSETFLRYLDSYPYAVVILCSENVEHLFAALERGGKPTIFILSRESPLHSYPLISSAQYKISEYKEVAEVFRKFTEREIITKNLLSTELKQYLRDSIELSMRVVKEEMEIPNFGPSKVNNLLFLQILGGLWFYDLKDLDVKDKADRSKYILDGIQRVDTLHEKIVELGDVDIRKREYQYQTIILSLPYVNKRLYEDIERRELRKVNGLDANALLRSLKTEQDPASFFHQDRKELKAFNEITMRSFALGGAIKVQFSRALESTIFLHSSFSFSPSYRGPQTGFSVDQYLEYFTPENFDATKDKKKLLTQIKKLGLALANRFDSAFIKYISDRNSPLVSISDLPMELMDIDGVPLFFKYDHCRVLETTYGSQLAMYTRHSGELGFFIDGSIMQKILVVCLVPDDPEIGSVFQSLREQAALKSELSSVVWEVARSIEELSMIVNRNKPQLLILDTHGSYRKDKFDSVLKIGDSIMDGNDIIKYRISAPLIILSACYTAPIQGYLNPIAQAFFEAGAYSVLSTTLPINVRTGSILYFRILNNLPMAVEELIHDNWCGFVSHVIRTSMFSDYLNYAVKKLNFSKKEINKKFSEIRTGWSVRSMNFSQRDECFKSLTSLISECFQEEAGRDIRRVIDFGRFVPDAYFYTQLGRGDLIKFVKNVVKN